jgi:hypothetical protein
MKDETENPCTLELTRRELDLILKYGYPFPEHAELLRASEFKNGWHIAHIDPYWVSMWIADIVRSARSIRKQSLLEELDALCDVLGTAEQRNSRIRGLSLD